MKLRAIWAGPILAGLLAVSPAGAGHVLTGPPGVRLNISPQVLNLRVAQPQATAQSEITVQVMAPRSAPWRLTVTALGPLQALDGSQIPVSQLSWHGSPGAVFTNGNLANHPQLVARGQGPKSGVLRFLLKNSWEYAEGQYSQRLLFTVSSP